MGYSLVCPPSCPPCTNGSSCRLPHKKLTALQLFCQPPNPDGVVLTATKQSLTIRANGNRPNPVGMPGEGGSQGAGTQVPNLDGLFLTATNQSLTIRANGDRPNPGGMPGEG